MMLMKMCIRDSPHQFRPQPGKPALVDFGHFEKEDAADGKLQHGVPQKFQALVMGHMVIAAVRGMGQRLSLIHI